MYLFYYDIPQVVGLSKAWLGFNYVTDNTTISLNARIASVGSKTKNVIVFCGPTEVIQQNIFFSHKAAINE